MTGPETLNVAGTAKCEAIGTDRLIDPKFDSVGDRYFDVFTGKVDTFGDRRGDRWMNHKATGKVCYKVLGLAPSTKRIAAPVKLKLQRTSQRLVVQTMDLENQPTKPTQRHSDRYAPVSLIGSLLTLGFTVWGHFLTERHGTQTNTEKCSAHTIVILLNIIWVLLGAQSLFLFLSVLNVFTQRKITVLDMFSRLFEVLGSLSTCVVWVFVVSACCFLWGNQCMMALPQMYYEVNTYLLAFWAVIALMACCCCGIVCIALFVGGVALGKAIGMQSLKPVDEGLDKQY